MAQAEDRKPGRWMEIAKKLMAEEGCLFRHQLGPVQGDEVSAFHECEVCGHKVRDWQRPNPYRCNELANKARAAIWDRENGVSPDLSPPEVV